MIAVRRASACSARGSRRRRDELVERLDVVREPADQDAGAVALEEADRGVAVAEELDAESASIRSPTSRSGTSGRSSCPEREARGEEEADDQQQVPNPLPSARRRVRTSRGTAARVRCRRRESETRRGRPLVRRHHRASVPSGGGCGPRPILRRTPRSSIQVRTGCHFCIRHLLDLGARLDRVGERARAAVLVISR